MADNLDALEACLQSHELDFFTSILEMLISIPSMYVHRKVDAAETFGQSTIAPRYAARLFRWLSPSITILIVVKRLGAPFSAPETRR